MKILHDYSSIMAKDAEAKKYRPALPNDRRPVNIWGKRYYWIQKNGQLQLRPVKADWFISAGPFTTEETSK